MRRLQAMYHYHSKRGSTALNRSDEAQADIECAPDDAQKRAESHHRLGILYTMEGNDEKALEQRREAARLAPDIARYHYELAVDLTNLDMLEDACDEFKKVLQLDSEPELKRWAQDNLTIIEHRIKARERSKSVLAKEGLKNADKFFEFLEYMPILNPIARRRMVERQGEKYKEVGAHEDAANIYTILGHVYRHLGDLSAALRYATEAYQQYEAGYSHPALLAETLIFLAEIHTLVGDTKKARMEYYQVIKVMNPNEWNRDIGDDDEVDTLSKVVDGILTGSFRLASHWAATVLNALGEICHRESVQADAQKCFQGARQVIERTKSWRYEALTRIRMGKTAKLRKEYKTAQGDFDTAIHVARAAGGHAAEIAFALGERALIETYLNNGDLMQATGSLMQALEWVNEAITIVESDPVTDPSLTAHLYYIRGKIYQTIAVRWAADQRYDDAYVDYGAAIKLVEDMRDKLELDLYRMEFFQDKLEAYQATVPLCVALDKQRPGKGFRQKAFEYAERSKSRSLLDLLSRSLDPDAAIAVGEPASLAAVQEILPERTLLLEYYYADDLFVIFPLTHDRLFEPFVAENPADYVEKVKAVYERFEEAFKKKPASADDTAIDICKEFFRLLFPSEPVDIHSLVFGEKGEPTIDRLIVVPHGDLHNIPFSMLHDGQKHLIEYLPVITYPSASAMYHLYLREQQAKSEGIEGEEYLGVAFPDKSYDGLASLKTMANIVEHIGHRQFGSRYRVLREGTADLPTPENFYRAAAEGYRFVNIAVHMHWSPPRLWLAQSQNGSLVPVDFGLEQLYNLKMPCECASLYGCYAGKSTVRPGDELEGLIRGFLHAGARSLTLAHWAIYPMCASIIMRSFFGYLKDEVPVAEAAQKAQVDMLRKERKHPYYWAYSVVGGHEWGQAGV
ncbi:CHAT domain-containing protein [Candidatus Poribacteria bacterium]|nr:CHAT domain-containing protein [Candidatus Poribacteria bacterium]